MNTASVTAMTAWTQTPHMKLTSIDSSVIVKDATKATPGKAAAHSQSYNKAIFPSLLQIQASVKPGDIPRIAEHIVPAAKTNKRLSRKMSLTLRKRLPEVHKKSARQRVTKLLRSLEHIQSQSDPQGKTLNTTQTAARTVNYVPKVTVDYDKCNGDWTCIEVCPVEVFEKGKHNDKEVSIVANEDACLVCMACVEQCPENAIVVEE